MVACTCSGKGRIEFIAQRDGPLLLLRQGSNLHVHGSSVGFPCRGPDYFTGLFAQSVWLRQPERAVGCLVSVSTSRPSYIVLQVEKRIGSSVRKWNGITPKAIVAIACNVTTAPPLYTGWHG